MIIHLNFSQRKVWNKDWSLGGKQEGKNKVNETKKNCW